MIPVGQTPETDDPLVQEAWEIIQSSDRSEAAYRRLLELSDQAEEFSSLQIDGYIESFVASLEIDTNS